MIFRLIIFFLIAYSSFSYGANSSYPPKSWWSEPKSIEEIEKQNEAWWISQIEKYKNATSTCTDSNIKAKKGSRINAILCESNDNEENPFLKAIESMRLSKSDGWSELKSMYQVGDEVRSYAAPPLSGGIGYILIRSGIVIHVYETAQQ